MSYAAVLVALAVGQSNEGLLSAARAVAARFDASLIGLAACRPLQAVCRDYAVPAPFFAADRQQIERQLAEAEAEFRSMLKDHAKGIEWRARTTLLPLSLQLAREAGSADLVVVGALPNDTFDATRNLDLADAVMQSARPILVVPAAASPRFERVLVAWNDGREAQRAIADSLPFLAKATSVVLAHIVAEQGLADARLQVEQLRAWLRQHHVSADVRLETPRGANAAQLGALADELRVDLVVAGAYGHMRARGWRLGDITTALLSETGRSVLLAH
jgi:nucleotide-binding universal stress UspA family protein